LSLGAKRKGAKKVTRGKVWWEGGAVQGGERGEGGGCEIVAEIETDAGKARKIGGLATWKKRQRIDKDDFKRRATWRRTKSLQVVNWVYWGNELSLIASRKTTVLGEHKLPSA